MTAKRRTQKPDATTTTAGVPVTRYRQKDRAIDAIEGAAVLNHTGESFPDGVTQGDEGLLFTGKLITESSYLVYDELGNPVDLLDAEAFKELYEFDAGARGNDALKGDLAEAHTIIKKLEDRVLEQDALIDDLRNTAAPSSDAALGVLRAIMKIEPAQVRDDGGRIIHLNRNMIERMVALL